MAVSRRSRRSSSSTIAAGRRIRTSMRRFARCDWRLTSVWLSSRISGRSPARRSSDRPCHFLTRTFSSPNNSPASLPLRSTRNRCTSRGRETMRNRLMILVAAGVMVLAVTIAATVQSLTGTVIDIGGNPLADVQIRFYDAVNAELLASATPDSTGRFASGNIPVRDYRVWFDPAGFFFPRFYGASAYGFCVAEIVPVLASITAVIDGQLTPRVPSEIAPAPGPGLLEGTVVDAATSAPLPAI